MEHDLIVEGLAATPSGVEPLQIGITDGKIAELKRSGLKAGRRLRDERCVIFPGFIDVHVHLREPGWEHKEDFLTGTMAAVHGGVTTLFDMPNNPEPADSREALARKAELSKGKVADVMFFGGVRRDRLSAIPSIKELVVGYKIFMSQTTGSAPFPLSKLREALEVIGSTSKPASVHAEDQSVIDAASSEVKASSAPDRYADARPPEAEVGAVRELLSVLTRCSADVRVNVCHVSTSSALNLIRGARRSGANVVCEATLHHLFFTRRDMLRSPMLRTNPPLRTDGDRRALLEGLAGGSVDFLVSDHAPHTREEKLSSGAAGVPGLDNYGNIVSWLIKKRGLSPSTVSMVTSANQARFFRLHDRGSITVGARADLAVLDLDSPETASADSVRSKCGWSPYEGKRFPGRVKWTVSAGRVVYEDGVAG